MHAQAAEPLPGPVPAEVVRVIDGDTVEVRARIWPGQFVETRVRLRGVDTPETRRPQCEAERTAGHAAAAFTEAWVAGPADADVDAGAAPAFSLYEVDLGSFAGRVVARLGRSDGADLSDALVAAGLAVAYGEDGPWCAAASEPSR
jgi:endonuclease YncB( thermonuclease family)